MSVDLEQLLDQLADLIAARLHQLQAGQEAGESTTSPWLSASSAASYLDWPLQRVYKLTAQGAIPHYKHDGRLLFNKRDLDQWLRDFRAPGDWLSGDNRAISR